MSTRAGIVLALLATSLLAAVVSGRDLFFNLVYVWTALLAVSFIWSRTALSGLKLERRTPSLRSQVGHPFEEVLALRNRSRVPKSWVEVEDRSELPGHRVSTVTVGLGSQHERTWIVRTMCQRRGQFRLGPATLHGGDPFGLFPVSLEVPGSHQLVVMPLTVRIGAFGLPSGQRPGGEALRHRTHQVTPSASSVRDYAPGDGFNRIHWPSTARRRRLIVKEFELDPKSDIWIFLDASRAVQAGSKDLAEEETGPRVSARSPRIPPSTEEYGVAAAASVAVHLLEQDRAVGLVAYGRAREVIQPDRGERQVSRLLESLAVLEADGWLSLEEVLKVELPQVPRGASLVLITSSISPGMLGSMRYLARRGLFPVAVLLDSESFGGPAGSQGLAAAARRAGFEVRLVTCGQDLGAALSTPAITRSYFAAA